MSASTVKCFDSVTAVTSEPNSIKIGSTYVNNFQGFQNRYDAILYTNEQIIGGNATVKLQTYHELINTWLDFETVSLTSTSARAFRYFGYIPGGERFRWNVTSYSSLAGASGPIQLTSTIQLR